MNRCPARCDRITGETAHFADDIDDFGDASTTPATQLQLRRRIYNSADDNRQRRRLHVDHHRSDLTFADRIATITDAM
ncbi:MAG TPA: hypothetical protein VGH98_03830 [Gemmatimonadaceae bacterium]|jgi:hypothetical protein